MVERARVCPGRSQVDSHKRQRCIWRATDRFDWHDLGDRDQPVKGIWGLSGLPGFRVSIGVREWRVGWGSGGAGDERNKVGANSLAGWGKRNPRSDPTRDTAGRR